MYRKHLRIAEAQYFQIGQQSRGNRVADQTGDSFLKGQGIGYTPNVPRTVFDADQNRSARCICKSHNGA